MLFLHLVEQKLKIEPSFWMNIIPVACGKGFPQNEQVKVRGKA
jgi:hypothetical protein